MVKSARMVRDWFGPLLELPGGPLQIKGRNLAPFELSACQTEIALCMGNVAGALRRLAHFIEAATWAVIDQNERLRDLGLERIPAEDCLVGSLPAGHELLDKYKYFLLETDLADGLRQRVVRILAWPSWLASTTTKPEAVEKTLNALIKAYNQEEYLTNSPLPRTAPPGPAGRASPQDPRSSGMSLRIYRNQLTHGWLGPINLSDLEQVFRNSGLLANINAPFGQNFLPAKPVKELLTGLGAAHLAPTMRKELDSLLNKVIN